MDDSELSKSTGSLGEPTPETDSCELLVSDTPNSSVPDISNSMTATDKLNSEEIPTSSEPDISVSTSDKPSSKDKPSTSETASDKPSSEDIQRVLNALLEVTDSTAEELEDDGIVTIAHEVRDIRRNLIDLLESIHSTAMELEGKDFHAMATIVRSNQKRGLFPSMMITEIKRSIMGRYERDINIEDYYQTLDILIKFSSNIVEHNMVNNLFYPKSPKMMAFLFEESLLTDEVFLEYMKINKENDNVRGKIAGFKSIDVSGIVEFMTALQEIGILSELLLSNYKTLAERCEKTNLAVDHHINSMKNMMTKLCTIGVQYPEKISRTMFIKEENLNYFTRCGRNISPKLFDEEVQTKMAHKASKIKICRSEHNIPFCEQCGWRNSWLKAFKKRGVYVKNAVKDTKEHTWSII